MEREVSESCIDSLLTEMVSSYCNQFYANKPELAARRIEAIGYQVGHQLSERYTMERPWFSDYREAIKFICKDFWSEVFKKQIDNLKTIIEVLFYCKIISVGGCREIRQWKVVDCLKIALPWQKTRLPEQ